jgi:hypothetical protein
MPMTKNITKQHLLLLSYGELSTDLIPAAIEAMDSDPELKGYYNQCNRMKAELDRFSAEPHPTSVSIVNEHSHNGYTESV